ncbi:hypothetical protein [Aureibacter tunicatorum]|uniref:Membrane-associated phospholipid phosphatase n=1 Tax=Aureibacter tunicatorum TaxID=866807 RepID=A0AAE3XK02_9BACT|nr:hypothetical protein [Aureibacter tunicatorum]MDR6237404.1 membrane-associated phospholipid phosphatase [Aureibacter tunicatorum]BDD06394.1 hypothetical protein AUTU_38770 [Aureibacter tunicatorum]
MTKLLSKLFSWVCHPLLLTTYIFYLLLTHSSLAKAPEYQSNIIPIVLIIFVTTSLFPALCIAIMRVFKMIRSFSMLSHVERVKPMVFISIFYTMTTYMFWEKKIFSSDFLVIFVSINLLVVLLTAINFFWKISIYSASITAMVGLLMAINVHSTESGSLFYPFLISIILAGIVMSSRMFLEKHSSFEVYCGSLLGFTIGYLPLTYLLVF